MSDLDVGNRLMSCEQANGRELVRICNLYIKIDNINDNRLLIKQIEL